MKFALISTHGIHKAQIKLNCREGDCTSFLSWVHELNGFHFNYLELQKEDDSYLKDFDLVMMSGDCKHIVDIIKIAKMLKDSNAVSMFFPEGSAQLYENSIRGFHKEYYEAWNACDILSIVEEDKESYYKAFVTAETLVKFIHVPITQGMANGSHLVPRNFKQKGVVVYGDNNPNHPLIAMVAAKLSGLGVLAVELGDDATNREVFNVTGANGQWTGKMTQAMFLNYLGSSLIHFYPTEWIGTARQVISCAAVGTPCIGNMHSHTQHRLFPELETWIYDIDKMFYLAERLMLDNSFYETVCQKAFKEMQFYNLENTTKRMTDAYEEAVKIKKKKVAIS